MIENPKRVPKVNGLPVLSRSDFKDQDAYARYVSSFVADLVKNSPPTTVDEILKKRRAMGLVEVRDEDILIIDPADSNKKKGKKIAKFLKKNNLDDGNFTPLPEDNEELP